MRATVDPGEARHSLPYMPGLDGVRAIAVAAVVLYHLDVDWLPGGFLGVDVFFVVSGFLITSLLLADVRRRGRFDVRDFWLRRARRLLPALTLVIVAVVLYVAVVLPHELAGLRGQALAAAGYVTNWVLIFTDTSYFEAFARPPLLRHLWSLAVEEQFYLLWPLAFAAGWALLRRRMLSVVWLGALGSTVLMALLYQPLADPSRVYFGTDTRALGLLVGVGLAYVTTPDALVRIKGTGARVRQELAGWAGLALLSFLILFGSEFAPAMYRGGFLLAALATLALIVGATGPTSLGKVLSVPVLVWIGRRSYGIYLWHWPVLMLTRPELDVGFGGARLALIRIGLTLGLAAASYRWVERPIIEHGFGEWLRGVRRPRRRLAQAVALMGGFAVLAASVVAMAVAPTPPAVATVAEETSPVVVGAAPDPSPSTTVPDDRLPPPDDAPPVTRLPSKADEMGLVVAGSVGTGAAGNDDSPPTDTTPAHPIPTVPVPVRGVDRLAPPPPETTTTPPPPSTTTTQPPPPPMITAIGDSVMLGAAESLTETLGDTLTVDALVSRSFGNGIDLVADLARGDELGDILIVHLGTNGPIDDDLVDGLMEAAADTERVFAITVRVPRRWETQVNKTLRAGAKRWPNLEIINWKGASDDRPELFVHDGVHLTGQGRTVYADLVANAVGPIGEP